MDIDRGEKLGSQGLLSPTTNSAFPVKVSAVRAKMTALWKALSRRAMMRNSASAIFLSRSEMLLNRVFIFLNPVRSGQSLWRYTG